MHPILFSKKAEQTVIFFRTIPKPLWAEVENTIKILTLVKQKIEGRWTRNVAGGFLCNQDLLIVAGIRSRISLPFLWFSYYELCVPRVFLFVFIHNLLIVAFQFSFFSDSHTMSYVYPGMFFFSVFIHKLLIAIF